MKSNKMVWVIFFSFIFFACGSSSSGPSSAAPRIDGAALFKVDEFNFKTETYSFTIGDFAHFEAYATDPDLDMQTLYIEQYLFPNLDVPYYPTGDMVLPSQSGPDMEYFPIEPVEVIGPAGDWRLCLWIVDKVGNESNEFCINYVVKPSGSASTAPRIDGAALFKVDEFGSKNETYSFTIGDLFTLEVYATDPDLDMQTLYGEDYLFPNLEVPISTSETVLPSQNDPYREYFLIDPVEVNIRAGNYRSCLWIVDKVGNESNRFCFDYVINL